MRSLSLSFQGNNSKQVFAPYTAKQNSVWDRVAVPDHAHNRRQPKSAGSLRAAGSSSGSRSNLGSAPAIPKLDLTGTTGGS
jgi:hypothetical protein